MNMETINKISVVAQATGRRRASVSSLGKMVEKEDALVCFYCICIMNHHSHYDYHCHLLGYL